MPATKSFIQAEIGLLIARLARVWRRKVDIALAEHGLSEATAHPLLILARGGTEVRQGVRQGVLAEEMGIEGPSLVRLIDLLQAEGLVERREDPTDRRAKTLSITALGEAKVAQINQVVWRIRGDLLDGISPDDLATTFAVLKRIEASAQPSAKAAAAVESVP